MAGLSDLWIDPAGARSRRATIELFCRRCGARYTVSRDDLLKGPGWWRYCPRYRPAR